MYTKQQIRTGFTAFVSVFLFLGVLAVPRASIAEDAARDTPQIIANSPYKGKAEVEEAFQTYFETVNEKFDSEENEKKWRTLSAANPEDLVLKTYWGSSVAMVGRDSFFPWNKLKYPEEAIKIFEDVEAAILDDPEEYKRLQGIKGFYESASVEALFIIANTYLKLPNGIFKTKARGEELLQYIQDDPSFAQSGENFKKNLAKTLAKAQAE